jgi:hypothetical protein
MELQKEIMLNQYGQSIIPIDIIVDIFKNLNIEGKKKYLRELLNLIAQSKPNDLDIPNAIELSNLKATYTPCVMLRKGIASHYLIKLVELPEFELEKSLVLLLSLFKIAYQRRFNEEMNTPNKWWYWDLSKKENLNSILDQNS